VDKCQVFRPFKTFPTNLAQRQRKAVSSTFLSISLPVCFPCSVLSALTLVINGGAIAVNSGSALLSVDIQHLASVNGSAGWPCSYPVLGTNPFPIPLRFWQSSSPNQHPTMSKAALRASAYDNNWDTHVLSHCPYCSNKRDNLQAAGSAGSPEHHLPSAGTQLHRAELSARA